MKILIAEDDARTRAGLVEVFASEGFETFAASSGREALALFLLHAPDVVCLDIMMPGQNGYDVCREIRKRNESVPVLFISAKSEEIDTVLGLELGADDFIVKPFGVKEVLAFTHLGYSPVLDLYATNELDLGELAPGEYRYRVVLHDKLRGTDATSELAFTITAKG